MDVETSLVTRILSKP